MRGQHKPGYVRPRKGEKRQQDKPLKVDRLPAEVRDAIQKARVAGRTWAETTEAAAAAAAKLKVAPPSEGAVRRWYDQRIEQVQKEVMANAALARGIAASFAGTAIEKLPDAVRNAVSQLIFSLLESSDAGAKKQAIRDLKDLGYLLARERQLDQEAKRLELESKNLDAIAAKISGVKGALGGKKKISNEELAKKLDEIYGLTQPNAAS